jgi:DNA-directed RNA polymerase I subunit RPA1
MGNTMEKKKLKAKGKKGRSKWIKKDFDRAIFVVAKGLHFEIYVKFTNEPHILLAEVCSRIEFWAFIVECILLLYLFVGQRYLLTKNFLYDRLQFSVLFTTVAHLWKLTSKTLVSDLSFFLHCWCWNLLLCFSSSRWDFHPFIDKLKKYEGTSIHFHAICS